MPLDTARGPGTRRPPVAVTPCAGGSGATCAVPGHSSGSRMLKTAEAAGRR